MTLVHQPTITEIISFVLRYRVGTNAFKDNTPTELYEYLQTAIIGNDMLVDADDFGYIRGLILAKSFVDDCRLHIYGIICLNSKCLSNFALWLRQEARRRNWTLTATRRGKIIEYSNTERFLNKLINHYG